MKNSFANWQILGFIFTGISGVILHFLYDLTEQNIFFAPFSAINESIWEHMKILFFPMFVFSFIEYRFIGKKHEKFPCYKLAGILIGLLLIPTIYYTYTGVTGLEAGWFNILIFYISSAIAYYAETQFFKKNSFPCKRPIVAFIILCLIAVLFIIFTFIQPDIPLFQDPQQI